MYVDIILDLEKDISHAVDRKKTFIGCRSAKSIESQDCVEKLQHPLMAVYEKIYFTSSRLSRLR